MDKSYDDINITDENLRLNFHTKFLTFIFSVGLFMVFCVAYLSLAGLKSDFDHSFPEPLNDINILNNFQSQYMAETIDILQNRNNLINPRLKSLYLWQLYMRRTEGKITSGSVIFMGLHNIYQSLFLKHRYMEIQMLKKKKMSLIANMQDILDSDSLDMFLNQNIILYNSSRVSKISSDIANIQVAINTLEKNTTDNFHTATIGMLCAVTILVFAIVISLSLVILTLIGRLNAYLNLLFNNATRELRELNTYLQEEIDRQVSIMRQKDNMVYVQSKLASMGEMIQNIAHQWRQPLNSLVLVIQSIRAKFDNNALTKEIMKNQTRLALNIAQNMSLTIDNFRNFFRLDTQSSHFYIHDALHYAISLHKPVRDSLNIKVDFKSADKIEIFGSKQALVQVLMVIFNNSKDAFVERNIPTPTCFIQTAIEENYVIIRYYDNAGGIESSIIDKVFEPYFTTKHRSLGTGVGLYMARQILQTHLNGEIYVENYEFFTNSIQVQGEKQLYKGALFTIKIRL